jgi:protein-S-isoprenylcysteine O-methyltransferase Ste14
LPGVYLALNHNSVIVRMSDVAGYSRREKIATVMASVVQYPFIITTLWIPLTTSEPRLAVGLLGYALGTVGYYAAIVQFARMPADRLTTNGLYRLSRHPMYCSSSLAFLAICLLSASMQLAGWMVAQLCFQHVMIRAEERVCGKKFGAEYTEYAKRVPRYLFLGRQSG